MAKVNSGMCRVGVSHDIYCTGPGNRSTKTQSPAGPWRGLCAWCMQGQITARGCVVSKGRFMVVRFGVLGAGRIGQVHARAIASVPGAVLVAIADPVLAAAQAVQNAFGGDIRTIAAIAAADDIDAVVICTPTDTHADLIEQFARARRRWSISNAPAEFFAI
jgi:hypothetical protein